MTKEIRVWDLPTRLFHWILVLLVSISWWTGENGYYEWHEKSGILLLCLIVFRLLWGFWGSHTARFADFLEGPGAVWAHMRHFARGQVRHDVGHNPLAGYAVLVLLGVLLVQAVLGLFTQADYGVFLAPWAETVSTERSETLTSWHKWFFDWVLITIGIHVSAILAYAIFQRVYLLGPMIHGTAKLDTKQPAIASKRQALICLVVAVILGWGGIALVEKLFS